jgi:hypothetical protein
MNVPSSGILGLKSQFSNDTDHPYNTFWANNYNTYTSSANTYLLSLLRVVLTNGVYPINRFNNMVYVVEAGGNTFTVTLDYGEYTPVELASTLEGYLNGGSAWAGSYTVTVNTRTSTFTVALAGHSFTFADVANNAYEVLGFYTANFSSGTSHTSDVHYNLTGTQYVELRMNLANNLNFFGDGLGNVVDMIPINVGFGETLVWEPAPGTYPSWVVSADQLNNVSLKVFDDHQNLWELPPPDHIEIVFAITPLNG